MLRFKGFKAVLNLTGKQTKERAEFAEINVASVSTRGAYRASGEEFYGYGSISQSSNSRISPNMVQLPLSQNPLRQTKSSIDLTANAPAIDTPQFLPIQQGTSIENLNALNDNKKSQHKRRQDKENRKIEKQRTAEQKKREKIIANEQAAQEKLKRDREKKEAQRQAKESKKNTPKPTQPAPSQRKNPLAQTTNTLESSISRESGPPPYEEVQKQNRTKNEKDSTGNTSFGKPVQDDSWDLVSKHREQMVRPTSNIGGNKSKTMVLDLQFDKMSVLPSRTRNGSNDGSEADA